jgi:hypothetical protein
MQINAATRRQRFPAGSKIQEEQNAKAPFAQRRVVLVARRTVKFREWDVPWPCAEESRSSNRSAASGSSARDRSKTDQCCCRKAPGPAGANVCTFLFARVGLSRLPILQIGEPLVFECHAQQFASRVGSGRKCGLSPAQEFKRTVGEVRRVMHRVTVVSGCSSGTYMG